MRTARGRAQGGHNVDSTGAGRGSAARRTAVDHQSVGGVAAHRSRSPAGPTVGTGATRGALKYQGAFDPASSIKATVGRHPRDRPAAAASRRSTDAACDAGTPVLALAARHVQHANASSPGATQTVTAHRLRRTRNGRRRAAPGRPLGRHGARGQERHGDADVHRAPVGDRNRSVVLTGARSGCAPRRRRSTSRRRDCARPLPLRPAARRAIAGRHRSRLAPDGARARDRARSDRDRRARLLIGTAARR